MLPLNALLDGAAAIGLSDAPQKSSEKQGSAPPPQGSSADRKRHDLPEPAGGPERRAGAKLSPKAIHWLWDQGGKPPLFGGVPAGSAGAVMGALRALAGGGAWKGSSRESRGEDVDEEKEETSLDCRLAAARGGARSRCVTASADGGSGARCD